MSASTRYRSWGGYPRAQHERVLSTRWRDDPLPLAALDGCSCLPFGNGRSYGDSCLNDGGLLIDARPLDRFIAFDEETGVLQCEAGVLLGEILALTLPRGWFLPVTPGTQFVTLGGAIANDVHGKNHHRAGSFGHHVDSLELLRSDDTRLSCSANDHAALFRATIGGLGLTGLITRAALRLKRVAGPYIDQELIPFADLAQFFTLAEETDGRFEHTVAWVDCAASGRGLGRGILMCGNPSAEPAAGETARAHRLGVRVTPPFSLVNTASVRLFNSLYYQIKRRRKGRSRIHYRPFFYPLDHLLDWNRIYGPRGFFQYQCVVPLGAGKDAMAEILGRIAHSGMGSFLAVLKRFGDHPPAGLLSFPREGYTLALDFPNRGGATFALLDALDEVTGSAGGAVYPAKDARMSAQTFRDSFPRWEEFAALKDPCFSSSLWRRVAETTT